MYFGENRFKLKNTKVNYWKILIYVKLNFQIIQNQKMILNIIHKYNVLIEIIALEYYSLYFISLRANCTFNQSNLK